MNLQYILELTGVGFFSISGALAAGEKSKPDWFGVTIIGFVTSLGGGSTRDILLGSYPLVWVKDVNFIYSIIIGIIFASIFYRTFLKIRRAFFLFDTLGIAMFTVLGTEKAMNYGVHPLIAAMMGMFSAIMGGVLRDVLTNEIPIIFKKEIYATACLAGAFFFLLLNQSGLSRAFNMIAAIIFIMIIRILAVKYNISLPKFGKEIIAEPLEK